MKKEIKPSKTKMLCTGCRDNFYNGNNNLGVPECWSFKAGKVVKKFMIPINMRPPYTCLTPRWCLSCFKGHGVAATNPEAIGKDGYWKH